LKNSAIAVNENIFWVETSGDHLQFTGDELMGWVEKYFMKIGGCTCGASTAIRVCTRGRVSWLRYAPAQNDTYQAPPSSMNASG